MTDYNKILAMFIIINKVIGVNAELLPENEFMAYQKKLNEKHDKSFLGIACNLKNLGSKVYTLDIFKAENRHLVEAIKADQQTTTSLDYKFGKDEAPFIFLNMANMEEYITKGYSCKILERETPYWNEYPVSLKTLTAVIIVHELTHCQLDMENYENCFSCFKCNHCDYFKKRMIENWDRIIKSDCLRKIDYYFFGCVTDPIEIDN